MQYQIWKVDHNEKSLQSTEQQAVPKEFDLLSNTSKTRDSKLYRCATFLILPSTYFCPNCVTFENQILSQRKDWLKRKDKPI